MDFTTNLGQGVPYRSQSVDKNTPHTQLNNMAAVAALNIIDKMKVRKAGMRRRSLSQGHQTPFFVKMNILIKSNKNSQ